MKIYIAGPMRGITLSNFPAFDSAAELLQKAGHEVYNPAENDRQTQPDWSPAANSMEGFDLRKAFAWDLGTICQEAEVVVLLPGWRASKGAMIEVEVARMIEIPLCEIDLDTGVLTPVTFDMYSDLLVEMRELHDRKAADYGSDEDPLANYRESEGFGVPAWLNCILRLAEKLVRIKSYCRKGRLENEQMDDAMLDIPNHGLIALQLWREAKQRSVIDD